MENTKATIDELRKILAYITKGYKVPKVIHDVIFKIAKYEVEEKRKVVLIKRDPNIHKGRIQAVYVNVIEGEAMTIHPSTVGGYGADFDGDSCWTNVLVYTKDKKGDFIPEVVHISEFSEKFKCTFLNIKESETKIVSNYSVDEDVYVDAISLSGEVEKKKILNWSIHENLEMFSLGLKFLGNYEFWVSKDHSVVVYDDKEDKIIRISPENIKEDPSRYYLIRKTQQNDLRVQNMFEGVSQS